MREADVGPSGVSSATPGRRLADAWPAIAVAATCAFLINLDQASVPVANPSISDALGASIGDLQWIYNAYLLPLAVFLVLAGTLADRNGRERVLVVGLALFIAGSLGAALAQSVEMLVGMRAVEGLGAALVLPSTISILRSLFGGRQLAAALGLWVTGAIAGAALGPVIAGVLLRTFSWQSVFWPNIVLGLVCIVLVVPRFRSPSRSDVVEPIHGLWNLGWGLGLAGLVWGLIEAGARGWTSPSVLVPLLVGAAVLALTIASSDWVTRARPGEPAADRRLLGIGLTIIVLLLIGAAGSFFLLAIYLQRGLGLSPLETGMRMLAQTGVAALVAPLAGRLIGRIGLRPMLVLAFAMQAVALVGLSRLDETSTYIHVVPYQLMIALTVAIVPTASLTIVLASAPADRGGLFSGLQTTALSVGNVLSVAVLGTLISSVVGERFLDALAERGLPALEPDAAELAQGSAPEIASYTEQQRRLLEDATLDAFTSAMGLAFLLAAVVSVFAIAVSLALGKRRLVATSG